MSVILLSGRKKVIEQKKKIIRKVGSLKEAGKEPSITATWRVLAAEKRKSVSFSRDNMNVYVDGNPIECTAYITDNGYDLDLLFDIGDNHGHIYSDVEGTEMTNYLFFDEKLVAQDRQTNLISKHKPEEP